MNIRVYPARSGVPFHSASVPRHLGNSPRRIHIPEHATFKRYLPLEEKCAAMRERMEKLKAKGMA